MNNSSSFNGISYLKGYTRIDEKFVKELDGAFEARLATAVAEWGSNSSVRVIGLTGPTCSGKTTAAKKLIEHLGDAERRVCTVSLDDFFKDQFSRQQLDGMDPTKLDFDSPDTLDVELLSDFTDRLFSCGVAEKPIFDFVKGERNGSERVELDDDDVLLLEGIQVLYPAVHSTIEAHGGAVLCVRPESGIEVDGVRFEPNLIRLFRRLVRDRNFRGASPEFTMGLWGSVRRNEDLNIFPYIDRCHTRIDTTLAYELNILAPYLRRYLGEMTPSDRYYADGMRYLEMINSIEGIESGVIAPNSLYREFV